MNLETIGKQMLSESKFYMGYSRWQESEQRYESWPESVARVMDMHRQKYADKMTPVLEANIQFAQDFYADQGVLGAQRALQFGGEQLFKHEARLYNCSSSHVDRVAFFQEAMYLLLCGCGVGFSVQKQHIQHLPVMAPRHADKSKVFLIPDSIEGWADAFGVLLSSYFSEGQPFPEYAHHHIAFDFSLIRPKGAFISGGFKAPGPDGLRAALVKCEALMDKLVSQDTRMTPIGAYDFVMHMADAVLSGGVRRSATICLFSKDDTEMLNAKTGNWFVENPQRGRSNNSVMLLRNEVTREEWATIMESVRHSGEPGFIFTDNLDHAYNPCVEIGMLPVTAAGESGFQMCNLTEINGAKCTTVEKLLDACRAGAILGTLQAGYTNFTYLSKATQQIVAREALLGVSITGWMNSPDILFKPENMIAGAEVVKMVNKEIAEMIGINAAARTTCAKPSGNASVLLGTASGIHGEHSARYFRHVQMSDTDSTLPMLLEKNPSMVEDSVWSANGTDKVIAFPIISKPGSIFKSDLLGVKQLDFVKLAQQYWVEHGTNLHLCTDERLRHNISNTITVDDWDEVEQYIFDNRQWFAGISLMAASGDKAFPQAPFTEVLTMEEITARYGDASLFASGLIVDGLDAFDNNLWNACNTAVDPDMYPYQPNKRTLLLQKDWVRRANQFANNYFGGNVVEMTCCLKDVYNLHKWKNIEQKLVPIDFVASISKQEYTDVSTMGAQACAGGVCDISLKI
jgi:ribonucleoside-triphosphate reductase